MCFYCSAQVASDFDLPRSAFDSDAYVVHEPLEVLGKAPYAPTVPRGGMHLHGPILDRPYGPNEGEPILPLTSSEPPSPVGTEGWNGHNEFRQYWRSLNGKRRRLDFEMITGSLLSGDRSPPMEDDAPDV